MTIRRASVAAALILLCAHAASANFIQSGSTLVEQFNGATLDNGTWQLHATNPANVTQNNQLTFAVPSSEQADNTTRYIAVPVGGYVRADVRVHNTGTQTKAMLGLTDNSGGNTDFGLDNYLIVTEFTNVASGIFYTSGGNGFGQSTNLAVPDNSLVTLQLTRDSASLASYSVFDSSQQLITSDSLAIPANNNSLYVVLSGGGDNTTSTVTFDNITVPLSAIPEPATTALLLISALPLLKRRCRSA